MPPPPPEPERLLGDERLTAAGMLFEVAGGLSDLLAAQIAEHDLVPSEFEVLLRLTRSPAGQLRLTDLARQIGLSSSGLTRLADRLEGRGLLERRPCPTDGRGSNALITDAGRELTLATLPGHLELLQHWFVDALPPARMAQLVDALRLVRDRVRPDAAAGATDPPAEP